MFKEIPLETLLKNKRINQKTYDKVKIAKEYIERKYNLKTIKDSKYNAILEKLNSEDLSDEAKSKILSELQHQETEELRKARQKQTIRDYESLTVIGRGAFGEVHVCRVIKTGDIVAIKKIKKELLAKKNQIIHVRNEQLFMSKVKSPWIVDLKASFQEDDFLYLVMEFLPGGDFMNLLIEKDKLTEEEARFYIAELILAVDSIHKLDCIHRDIKPDNILIDKNGHIKLSDFGLAKVSDKLYEQNSVKDENFNPKKMTHKKLYSCVGTAYYVAPEVLNKKGYGQEIDWWSVGVIFFEMLVGYAPFCAQETQEVCFKILNWEKYLQIPPEIKLSNEANDLIKRMISDPNKRLGKNGADEIKAHPFFKGVDWEHIRETMKPPFVPEIKNDYDTKYFETFEIEEPFYPPTRKIPKRKDFEYLGFTYKKEDDLDNVITNMINKSKEGNDNNEEKKSE
jgi:serine/threonine kinase 38